jgi:hypothetical protein
MPPGKDRTCPQPTGKPSHWRALPTQMHPNTSHSFRCQGKAKHRQFCAILFCIAFPHLHSKETLIVFMPSFLLVLRMVLSIAVAKLVGIIVRDLVRGDLLTLTHTSSNIPLKVKGDGKGFLKSLGLWFLLAIPSTCSDSMASTGSLVEATY